jgi:hypothetical protein
MAMSYAPADSSLGRSILGDYAGWTNDTYLLALAVDALHDANFQRGGNKGVRPDRVERPQAKKKYSFGSDPIPIGEFNDWWDGA